MEDKLMQDEKEDYFGGLKGYGSIKFPSSSRIAPPYLYFVGVFLTAFLTGFFPVFAASFFSAFSISGHASRTVL